MDSDPPPAPPKKRSLFSQKAFSKPRKAADEEELTFSRAKELAAERLAEEERKRQKRISKIERKRSTQNEDRKRSTKSAENIAHMETPTKKRKVSVNLEEKDGNASDSNGPEEPEEPIWERRESTVSSPESPSLKRPSSLKRPQRSSPNTLAARYSKSLQTTTQTQQTAKGYVSISDSDDSDSGEPYTVAKSKKMPIAIDDDDGVILVSAGPPLKPKVDESQIDEDEEFPELVQRARERERLRLEQAANAARSFSEKNHSNEKYDAFSTEAPKDVDPSIEILITSRLEGTIALRVKRKMSQRLREARFAWCDRQNLPQSTSTALKETIFLTWKRKRVYDTTTCTALGLKSSDSGGLSDDEGMIEGKVHLEAWTEETLNAFEKEEEAARIREGEGDSEQEEAVPIEAVIKVRLVLKAKDMEPVKIFVKNSTVLGKLIMAFRQARDIPEDKEISLYFDGDELDPEDKVEDTELDELDTVEVHIK